MKKALIALLSFLILVLTAGLFVHETASAQASCIPIYGGGQICPVSPNIFLNKTVLNPATGQFVDNLGINDPKYIAGQVVQFQVAVINTGNVDLINVVISDQFPQFVQVVPVPGVSFNPANQILTFTIPFLGQGQTQVFTLQGLVTAIPQNQGVVCVVNQASATTQQGQVSQDNAQFCIQQPIVPTVTPIPTGPTITPGPTTTPAPTITPGGPTLTPTPTVSPSIPTLTPTAKPGVVTTTTQIVVVPPSQLGQPQAPQQAPLQIVQIPGQAIPPVTKGGVPVFPPGEVIVTPPTGAEHFALLSLLITGIGGITLRRFTKKQE